MRKTRIPSVVQLPGGVRLNAVPFKIVEYNEDGTPKLFELLPAVPDDTREVWFLFADEKALRAARQPEGDYAGIDRSTHDQPLTKVELP